MDDAAHAEAYAAADFSEPHNRFVELCRRRLGEPPVDARVLDLGCGAADITIRYARAFPRCTLAGIDGADAMLARGRRAVADAGLERRITLHQIYLPANLERGYHAIISNSLLHHLREPRVLWQSIRQAALPGAAIFVMDLLRPASEAAARRLVETYAATENSLVQSDFYNSLRAAYRLEEVRVQIAEAGLIGLTCEAVSDRHWIVCGNC